MPKPEWILFDVGGVLLDWRKSSEALSRKLVVGHDVLLSTMFKHAPKMNIGIISPQEGWKLILEELGSSMNPQVAIEEWRKKEFWFGSSLSLLSVLREAGYKLAILSNSWLGLSIEGQDATIPDEIAEFSLILDSSVEGLKKPDPSFYMLAEKTIGVKGHRLFLIDDDAPNLIPARDRGWQTFLFDINPDDGKTVTKQLRELLLSAQDRDSYI